MVIILSIVGRVRNHGQGWCDREGQSSGGQYEPTNVQSAMRRKGVRELVVERGQSHQTPGEAKLTADIPGPVSMTSKRK